MRASKSKFQNPIHVATGQLPSESSPEGLTHISGGSEGVLDTVVFEPLYPLLLALEQFLLRSCPLLLCSWLCNRCQVEVAGGASYKAHLIVGHTGHTADRDPPPPSVRPNPKIRMNLVLRNDLAL
jgi:hypothetical protein